MPRKHHCEIKTSYFQPTNPISTLSQNKIKGTKKRREGTGGVVDERNTVQQATMQYLLHSSKRNG